MLPSWGFFRDKVNLTEAAPDGNWLYRHATCSSVLVSLGKSGCWTDARNVHPQSFYLYICLYHDSCPLLLAQRDKYIYIHILWCLIVWDHVVEPYRIFFNCKSTIIIDTLAWYWVIAGHLIHAILVPSLLNFIYLFIFLFFSLKDHKNIQNQQLNASTFSMFTFLFLQIQSYL